MDLEELSAFLEVVETGSFLAAAETLCVSRTTLRRRVGALESRAGVPLLMSTRQGVVLTEAGQVLARRGRTMMQETRALLSSIREVGQEPSGVLRVMVPVGLPPQGHIALHTVIRAHFPRLRIELQTSNDPLGETLLDIDMALHFGEDSPRGPWSSHTLMKLRQHLMASRDYLQRHGTPGSIDELRRHELLAWRASGEDPRLWPTWQGATFRVEPVIVASDIHLLRCCCVAGLGIGLVPDALLPDLGLAGDALVPVLPELVGRELSLRVSVPAALADTPKIAMVLKQLLSFLGAA